MTFQEFKYIYQKAAVIEYPNEKGDGPLVSVCVQTYQHAPYIRECLDGILMQKTDFPFEILLGEDASTDGTREICLEYANKYPDRIRLFLHDRRNNIAVLGKATGRFNFLYNIFNARGRYIALCEGDDYWTDALKLQKQVDLLQENPDCSLVVGGYRSFNENTGEEMEVVKKLKEGDHDLGYSFDLLDTLKGWITKTLTAVFRSENFNLDEFIDYRYSRDINLFYHLLKKSKGFYITEVLGVYRIHEGGVNSMKQGKVNQNNAYWIYRELFEVNRDEFTRAMSLRCALELFSYDLYNDYEGNSPKKNLQTLYYAASLVRNWRDFRMLLNSFLSRDLKTTIKGRLSIASDKQEDLSERLLR
jgi:glycosyltransferase involved in cell wall biosynthesis